MYLYIHSFRGGTGKSNTTANLAALLAIAGKRVAVVDTDIQSPGIHVLFQMQENDFQFVLNDFLWGRCEIEQTAHDVTDILGPDPTKGHTPQIIIPAETWMGFRILDDQPDAWGLYGVFCAPGWHFDDITLSTGPKLGEQFPDLIPIMKTLRMYQ